MGVQVTSLQGPSSPLRPCSLRLQDSLDLGIDPLKNDSMLESIDSESMNYEFSDYHGKNIQICDDRHTARRTKSFNNAIAIVSRPLCRGQSISVSIQNHICNKREFQYIFCLHFAYRSGQSWRGEPKMVGHTDSRRRWNLPQQSSFSYLRHSFASPMLDNYA